MPRHPALVVVDLHRPAEQGADVDGRLPQPRGRAGADRPVGAQRALAGARTGAALVCGAAIMSVLRKWFLSLSPSAVALRNYRDKYYGCSASRAMVARIAATRTRSMPR